MPFNFSSTHLVWFDLSIFVSKDKWQALPTWVRLNQVRLEPLASKFLGLGLEAKVKYPAKASKLISGQNCTRLSYNQLASPWKLEHLIHWPSCFIFKPDFRQLSQPCAFSILRAIARRWKCSQCTAGRGLRPPGWLPNYSRHMCRFQHSAPLTSALYSSQAICIFHAYLILEALQQSDTHFFCLNTSNGRVFQWANYLRRAFGTRLLEQEARQERAFCIAEGARQEWQPRAKGPQHISFQSFFFNDKLDPKEEVDEEYLPCQSQESFTIHMRSNCLDDLFMHYDARLHTCYSHSFIRLVFFFHCR
jgi:hypothetical protein